MLRSRVLTILALGLLVPGTVFAGKNKKDQTPPPQTLADQPKFDFTKIVWPGPPEIPRVAMKDVFTGQKVDPNLFVKKAKKATWMDRLAGSLPSDQVDYSKLPFQLIRTYGVGVDSTGKSTRRTKVWPPSSSSIRRRRTTWS